MLAAEQAGWGHVISGIPRHHRGGDGLTPRQFIELAAERGFGAGRNATPIIAWLAADFGIGRGHAIALVHVITRGATLSAKHVGSAGAHADASDALWLDGRDSRRV